MWQGVQTSQTSSDPLVFSVMINMFVLCRFDNCLSYGYNTSTVLGVLRISRVFRPFRALRIGGLRVSYSFHRQLIHYSGFDCTIK